MANRIDYSHLVQSYFDNEMSAEERVDFEQLIERDTQLQQEFSLQKDIVEGIRSYRAQERKASLNAVSVGGILWTTGLRWTVGTAAALVIATAGYFFLIPERPASYSEVDFGSGVVLELAENQFVPVKPIVQENIEEAIETPQVDNATVSNPAYTAPSITSAATSTDNVTNEVAERESTVVVSTPTPTLTIPEFGNETNSELEVAENPLEVPGATFVERNRTSPEEKIDMELVEDRRHSFHYQFFNNKLYLYGDFEGKIYEIIEFNNQDGREFYFYFQQKFYPIEIGQREITELAAVTSKALETSLEQYRQNNLR